MSQTGNKLSLTFKEVELLLYEAKRARDNNIDAYDDDLQETWDKYLESLDDLSKGARKMLRLIKKVKEEKN